MKHNLKITIILLAMFFLTQMIGLAVIHADIFHIKAEINGTIQTIQNPQLFWISPPEEMKPYCPTTLPLITFLTCIIKSITPFAIAFLIAIILILFLMKKHLTLVIRLWFFVVVVVAIFLCAYAFEKLAPWIIDPNLAVIIPLLLALPLAFYKIFKGNLIIHNLTELLIYPGIAAIFVPILNIWAIVLLLLLISVYDIYAVWHSGFMQKMAKFQINKVKVFAGFFVPYADKKTKLKIKALKQKYKNKKILSKTLKSKKIKVSLAILGGGDVVFPIIMAGVIFRALGFLPAITISIFATISLLFLFIAAKKGKFYPAMPFITAGCLAGLLVGYLISII